MAPNVALALHPFRVDMESSVRSELGKLSAAQQKSVERKLAAAAELAGLREHPGGDEWLEISAGPVVLECRADDRLRLLNVVGVRRSPPRRPKK